MTPKPQTPKPEALPATYQDVEPGDHVYVRHPERGPMAVRVLATGKHGLTATCPMGDLYRVHWERVLGVKARMNRKFKLVDNGAEGCILEDDQGQRRYVAHAEDDGEEDDDKPDPKPKPKAKKIAKAFPDHARALFLKTFIQGYVKRDGTTVQAHTDKRHPARVAARITEKLGGKIIGNAMPKDIAPVFGHSLLGASAATPEELAAACQAYRNPLYETLRVFFARKGTIVGQCGFSAKLPGTTPLAEKFEAGINAQTERLKADQVWLVHNHPSGDPTPSPADKETTTDVFAAKLKGFSGHIIIDHGRYSAWTPETGWRENISLEKPMVLTYEDWERIGPPDLRDSPDFSIPSGWLLASIGHRDAAETLAEIATKARKGRSAIIVSLTQKDLKITAIAEYPHQQLSDPEDAAPNRFDPDGQARRRRAQAIARMALLHLFAVQTGAVQGMVLFCDHADRDSVFWLYRAGVVRDIVTADESGNVRCASRDFPPENNVTGHRPAMWPKPIKAKEVERFFEEMGYPPPRIGFQP